MKNFLVCIDLLNISPLNILAQDENRKAFDVSGYITTLQSAMFDTLSGPFYYENLLHNRLNFRGYINKNVTLAVDLRNRLFTGDMVRSYYGYSDMIATDDGWADLSWNIIDENSFFLNTTIDRMWLDLNFNKFQATIGRQRINWGQTFVWNPNDIFNAIHFSILIILKGRAAMRCGFSIILHSPRPLSWLPKSTVKRI